MSKHLVDPELLAVLETMPMIDFATNPDALDGVRDMMALQLAAMPKRTDLPVLCQTIVIEGPEGAPSLRLLSYRPEEENGALPAILHIHGGGYIIGTADMMDAVNRELAVELNCAIFSVDYRLAPNTRHPGPVEDCYAALKWIHANAAAQGVDPARIGVKGESAGGGLAAGLALLARDRGEVPLAFQHLIYPMIDDRSSSLDDPHPFTGDFLWTPGNNAFGWTALLGVPAGSEGVSPYAAAARAQDLRGLPPAFISVGALDLFLEENMDYARRLTRAGVPLELHVYPGAFHGFDLGAQARVAIASANDSKNALKRALHG